MQQDVACVDEHRHKWASVFLFKSTVPQGMATDLKWESFDPIDSHLYHPLILDSSWLMSCRQPIATATRTNEFFFRCHHSCCCKLNRCTFKENSSVYCAYCSEGVDVRGSLAALRGQFHCVCFFKPVNPEMGHHHHHHYHQVLLDYACQRGIIWVKVRKGSLMDVMWSGVVKARNEYVWK